MVRRFPQRDVCTSPLGTTDDLAQRLAIASLHDEFAEVATTAELLATRIPPVPAHVR